VPESEEQREISDYIRHSGARYEDALNKSSSLISLLQERRSALISAAVTGQIDVRGLVPEAVAA
jgi:type I restriction enzyme S subunit